MRKLVLAIVLIAGAWVAPLPGIVSPGLAQAPPPVPPEPDAERRTRYTGVSNVTTFPVGFDIYGDSIDYTSWVEVWVNGVKQVGNWSLVPTSGSFSTLARPLLAANLNIVFSSGQTGTVDIVGARRPRRVSQLAENRGVTARDFNQLITDIVMQNREAWDRFSRSISFEPGFSANSLPIATVRANGYLCFNSSGQPSVCGTPTGFGLTALNGQTGNISIVGGANVNVSVVGSNIQISTTTTPNYLSIATIAGAI
jgi:hypothetical protein